MEFLIWGIYLEGLEFFFFFGDIFVDFIWGFWGRMVGDFIWDFEDSLGDWGSSYLEFFGISFLLSCFYLGFETNLRDLQQT